MKAAVFVVDARNEKAKVAGIALPGEKQMKPDKDGKFALSEDQVRVLMNLGYYVEGVDRQGNFPKSAEAGGDW